MLKSLKNYKNIQDNIKKISQEIQNLRDKRQYPAQENNAVLLNLIFGKLDLVRNLEQDLEYSASDVYRAYVPILWEKFADKLIGLPYSSEWKPCSELKHMSATGHCIKIHFEKYQYNFEYDCDPTVLVSAAKTIYFYELDGFNLEKLG